jgi:hypothetical protein
MPPPRNREWLGLLGRYFVLVTVLGVIATSAYAVVDIDQRSVVLRIAVAAFVAIVLIHVHGRLGRRLDLEQPSPFDQARASQRLVAEAPPIVGRLYEQVQQSVASQRYFERVLWPRLERLGTELGTREDLDVSPLRRRRWRGRGPSLQAIAELLRRIGGGR